jgi:hypothetical protein
MRRDYFEIGHNHCVRNHYATVLKYLQIHLTLCSSEVDRALSRIGQRTYSQCGMGRAGWQEINATQVHRFLHVSEKGETTVVVARVNCQSHESMEVRQFYHTSALS